MKMAKSHVTITTKCIYVRVLMEIVLVVITLGVVEKKTGFHGIMDVANLMKNS
jgi:hypothetical protein